MLEKKKSTVQQARPERKGTCITNYATDPDPQCSTTSWLYVQKPFSNPNSTSFSEQLRHLQWLECMQLAHTCPTVACIYSSYPTCCVQIVTSFVMNFLQGIDLQPRDLGGKVSCVLLWSRMQYFTLTFLFGSHSPLPYSLSCSLPISPFTPLPLSLSHSLPLLFHSLHLSNSPLTPLTHCHR